MTEQNTQHLQLSGSEKAAGWAQKINCMRNAGVFGFFDPEGSMWPRPFTRDCAPCSTGGRNPAVLPCAIPQARKEI